MYEEKGWIGCIPTNILKGSQTEGYKIISMTAVQDEMRGCSQKKKMHPASVAENRIKMTDTNNENGLTLIMKATNNES